MVGNSGVESALGNVGVESQGTDIGRIGATTASFCAARRNETESLRALLVGMVLPLEVLYDTLLRLLDESADAGTDTGTGTLLSESNLSKLFVHSKENLLKQGYFSECLATALANILRKNPCGSLRAICSAPRSVAPLWRCLHL